MNLRKSNANGRRNPPGRKSKKNLPSHDQNLTNQDQNLESIDSTPLNSAGSSNHLNIAVQENTAHNSNQVVDLRARYNPSERSDTPELSSITSNPIRKIGEGLKFAKDLIPEFNGTNMSVSMFTEQCKAAAALLEPNEMIYLAILVRNRVTGPARRYIQDRVGITLDEILRILQSIYIPREDTSQLTQELANIQRNIGETISDYGTRVSVLLNKIISKVMERNPGEKGRERCEEYIENAIKNFVRGLDRDTLIFMKDKSPPTLDFAIELAAEADLENKSWNRVHENEASTSVQRPNSLFNSVNRKRVAHISIDEEGSRSRGQSPLIQCFKCKKSGHFKRNCPQLERGKPLSKFCKYCEVKGHEIRECFLKEKHDKEREAKRARYLTKADLNSKKGHHAGATMTSNKTQRPKIVYSSASNNQTEGSETLQ